MTTEALSSEPAAIKDLPDRARLDSLDLLRGVAILGILLMNTQSMSMPSSAYYNPADYGDLSSLNYGVWIVIHLLADVKFITTFSILFGAGIVLQAERLASRGKAPAVIHYRRMAVLLVLGLIHAHGLWFGDILVPYAILGMLLFPFRRLPPGLLILTGVLFIATAAFCAYCVATGIVSPVLALQDWSNSMTMGVTDVDFQLTTYRGGWWHQMDNRFWLSLDNETAEFLLWTGWRCGGAMLIGMGLLRLRFFHGEWTRAAYVFIAALAIPVGWCITGLGIVYMIAYDWNWDYLRFPGEQFNYWGSLLTAIGYLCLGVLIALRASASIWLSRLLAPIRSVGRTALSNYILQTLICTTIFYGHGFGMYGKVSRVQLLELTIAIWTFQLIVSTIWLKIFKQGPLEWLWHRLVYGPARRRESTEGLLHV